MSIMNSYATEAAATDTVLNPVLNPVLDIAPDNLDTERVLSLLGLAEPETTDFLHITFEKDECEAIVTVRDGVEYRYMRNQQQYVQVTADPSQRGSWRWFSAKCTLVYFVKNDNLIGQTAILPVIDSLSTARALTAHCVEVCNDSVKVMNWKS